MSSEIYELMKRPDELDVVEKAHRSPRFVEDCVREMVRMATERFADLDDAAFVSARQENLETIHKHNVVAERHGLLGELRHEMATGERGGRQVTMRDWLEGDRPRSCRLDQTSSLARSAPCARPAMPMGSHNTDVGDLLTQKHIPLSQDAALVVALAGTAMPFAHSAEDEAERWLRALRLHGQVGVALQALGVGESPLMTGSASYGGRARHPADGRRRPGRGDPSRRGVRRGAPRGHDRHAGPAVRGARRLRPPLRPRALHARHEPRRALRAPVAAPPPAAPDQPQAGEVSPVRSRAREASSSLRRKLRK